MVTILVGMSRPCRVQGCICSRSIIDFVSVLVVMVAAMLVLWMGHVHNLAIFLHDLCFVDPGQELLQEGGAHTIKGSSYYPSNHSSDALCTGELNQSLCKPGHEQPAVRELKSCAVLLGHRIPG